MARGYLGGIVLGGIVGAAGLALLSQSLPLPQTAPAEPEAAATGQTAETVAAAEPVPQPPTEVSPPVPEAAAEALAPAGTAPAIAESPAPAQPDPVEAADTAPPAPADSKPEPAETAPSAPPPPAEGSAPEVAPEDAPAPAGPSLPEPSVGDGAGADVSGLAPQAAPELAGSAAPDQTPDTPSADPVSAEGDTAPAAPAGDAAPAVTILAQDAPAAPVPSPDERALPAGDSAPAPGGEAVLDAATPAESVVPTEVPPAGTAPMLAGTDAPDLPAGNVAAGDLARLPLADLPPPGTGSVVELDPGTSGSELAPETAEAPPPPPLTPEEEALLEPAPLPAREPSVALIVPDEPPVAGQGSLPPDPSLMPGTAEVRTGRLPQVGADASADSTATPPAEDTRPLVRFARPFTREAGKPLFSVLLVDAGGPDVDRTALASLPFPVTFVVDPMAADATTAQAIYRAAGQEVVMAATGIPDQATAADLEQTFQAHQAALDESVAVIDLPEGGFGADRPLASLVVPVVQAAGRGLITYDTGLNAGAQVAQRNGLPAATVFRRLDAEDESRPMIRRYLDRAAFKAAQDGSVMVIGSTRPETVAAILEWSVEGRATTVSLAPASAVLLSSVP